MLDALGSVSSASPVGAAIAETGVDSRSLDALRSEASRDPKSAAHKAAVQFESLFMQQVLKGMRDATIKGDDTRGGPGEGPFTDMLDSQLARQFAGRPGGLADVIERQLTQHMQNLPAVSPQNAAAGVSGAGPLTRAAPVTPALPGVPAGPVAPGGHKHKQAAFIEKMLPHARAAERATGVPASFILGQAALESGWGKGEMRNTDGSASFNLFGVKATSQWKGATTDAPTTEFEAGRAVKQNAKFRSYASYSDAFSDYARMLVGSSRYGAAVKSASAEGFAGQMQRAGYATDPQYASKLARTINHTLALQRAMG